MHLASPSSGRRAGAVAFTSVPALVVAVAGLVAGPAVARAAEAGPAVEYSSDGGETWGGSDRIDWNTDILVPGEESRTTFRVRNVSGHAAVVGFALGEYTVTPGTVVAVRVDVDGVPGDAVGIDDSRPVPAGTPVGAVRLGPGAVATVSLVLAMPEDAADPAQGGFVNPMWVLGFTPDGAAPGCGPGESLDSAGTWWLGVSLAWWMRSTSGSLGSAGGWALGSAAELWLGSAATPLGSLGSSSVGSGSPASGSLGSVDSGSLGSSSCVA